MSHILGTAAIIFLSNYLALQSGCFRAALTDYQKVRWRLMDNPENYRDDYCRSTAVERKAPHLVCRQVVLAGSHREPWCDSTARSRLFSLILSCRMEIAGVPFVFPLIKETVMR